MYDVSKFFNSKMCNLRKIYIILIIQLTINEIEMEEYRVGSTVNIFSQNNNAIGDIFNGFNGSQYINKPNLTNKSKYRMVYKSCLLFESLKQYYYPEVYIDGKESNSIPSRLFRHIDFLNDHKLEVPRDYVNDNFFRYGIVKVCKKIEKQSVNIDLIVRKDFPQNYDNGSYNILRNKTAALRFRRDNETHYISAVLTGNCLIQIFVKDKMFCENNTSIEALTDEFFKNVVFKSSIVPIKFNEKLARAIDSYYYLNDINYSLYTFFELYLNHGENIFNKFEDSSLLNLELKSLPEMLIYRASTSAELKKVISREDIIPGDVLNIEELIDHKSENISVKNILLDRNDYVTAPFVTSNYENCFQQDKNDSFIFGNSGLNYFESQMWHRNYGVDRGYVSDYVTCLKIIICSGLIKQNLHFSLDKLIRFNEKLKDNNRYNIFENETILLWFSDGNETHYVTQTEKGNCLLQTMIYPEALDYYTDKSRPKQHIPIHKGRILSATNNYALERWAETISQNDLRNVIGDKKNMTMVLAIFDKLNQNDITNRALIRLSLEQVY